MRLRHKVLVGITCLVGHLGTVAGAVTKDVSKEFASFEALLNARVSEDLKTMDLTNRQLESVKSCVAISLKTAVLVDPTSNAIKLDGEFTTLTEQYIQPLGDRTYIDQTVWTAIPLAAKSSMMITYCLSQPPMADVKISYYAESIEAQPYDCGPGLELYNRSNISLPDTFDDHPGDEALSYFHSNICKALNSGTILEEAVCAASYYEANQKFKAKDTVPVKATQLRLYRQYMHRDTSREITDLGVCPATPKP